MLTQRAVACGLEQIQQLHDWDTRHGGVKLALHLGLGAGPVRGVDLGNHMRREYVVAGEALRQLSDAEQQAGSGQLCVSPEAWQLVSHACNGSTLPTTPPFGQGFMVVHKCSGLRRPPHWRALLEEQLLNTTPFLDLAGTLDLICAPSPSSFVLVRPRHASSLIWQARST